MVSGVFAWITSPCNIHILIIASDWLLQLLIITVFITPCDMNNAKDKYYTQTFKKKQKTKNGIRLPQPASEYLFYLAFEFPNIPLQS